MDDVPSIIRDVRFSTVRLRKGYDQDAVDDFLDTLAVAAEAEQDLAPLVEDARFPTTSLRESYDIEEVDAFLRSVRAGSAGTPGGAPLPEPDPASTPVPRPVPRPVDDGVISEVPGLFSRLFGRR